jgi:flagellar hook assembly protein FlgD
VPAEGRWTLTVVATDDQAQVSSTVRRFWVNSTLGFLKVQPRTLVLPPAGRSATITWTQARTAQVTVTLETASGIVVRTIAKRRFEPGQASVVWDGRQRDKTRAFTGAYRVRVAARNGVGSVSLEQQIRVRRVAGPKK